MYKITAAIVFAAFSGSALAVYKCPGPGGTTVFQQSPCAYGDKPIEVNPATPDPRRATRTRSSAPEQSPLRAPVIGVSRDAAIQQMGPPDRVNSNKTASGETEQLVYSRDGKMVYVHIRNGVVNSVQEMNR